MARINQDLSGVSEDEMGGGGWSAWPQGDYRMMVVGSEYKPTKAGNGHCLHLELVCLDGEHRDQKKFDVMTLEHPNEQTTQIARAHLKELAIAIGHPTPDYVQDSEELHGQPVIAYITRKKSKDPQYGDSQGFENRIAGYKATEAGQAAPPPRQRPNGGAPPLSDEPPF